MQGLYMTYEDFEALKRVALSPREDPTADLGLVRGKDPRHVIVPESHFLFRAALTAGGVLVRFNA